MQRQNEFPMRSDQQNQHDARLAGIPLQEMRVREATTALPVGWTCPDQSQGPRIMMALLNEANTLRILKLAGLNLPPICEHRGIL